jgi:hypothetical protein
MLYRREERTPPLDLANSLRGMALLKEQLGEVEAAVASWEEARALFTSVQVEAGVVECTARLARLSPG